MSTRYKELQNEIMQLRKDLLPKRFKRIGQYAREDITRTLAYCVLAHAEIEAYLEDRAWDTALTAVRAWKNNNRVSKTLLALISFSGRLMDRPPSSISPEKSSQGQWDEKIKLGKKVDLATNDFYHVVLQNHGVKEENIIRLLLPIGIDSEDLDTVLVADLNSFGGRRGMITHKASKTFRTTGQIDPKEEEKTIRGLVKDMVSFDREFNKLLAAL